MANKGRSGPLRRAQELDEQSGHAGMMTQYNPGWSPYSLGGYEAAIAAFTKGIASQPDYPFACFRRGLAYDRTGRVDKAEADFGEFVAIFENEDVEFNQRFSDGVTQASEKYIESKVLLEAPNRAVTAGMAPTGGCWQRWKSRAGGAGRQVNFENNV